MVAAGIERLPVELRDAERGAHFGEPVAVADLARQALVERRGEGGFAAFAAQRAASVEALDAIGGLAIELVGGEGPNHAVVARGDLDPHLARRAGGAAGDGEQGEPENRGAKRAHRAGRV